MRFIPILIGALLFSCSAKPDAATATDSLSSKKNLPSLLETPLLKNVENLFVVGKEEVVLKTAKGTRIYIPKEAFSRKDGSVPTQPVKVLFKEYQTRGEILASGLPMVYTDPEGKTWDFESAGMFEIRALEGTDTLLLKEGKQVKVELATPVSGKFHFYELNDYTRSWTETARNLSEIRNPRVKELADSLKKLDELIQNGPPKKALSYQPKDRLFDIKADPEVYPEFKEIGGVMWKYVGTDRSKDPSLNQEYFNRNYELVSLKPAKGKYLVYDVSFVSGSDTVQLPMAPAFPGKLKQKYEKQLREKLERFNQALEEQEAIREQQRKESELLRVFQVDKLGIYNYDRQLKGDAIRIEARFFLEDKPQSDFQNLHVYLLPKSKLCVIKYDEHSAGMFAIDLAERNQLIAITAENELYALSDAAIRGLNLARYRSKSCDIHLKRIGRKVTSGAAIDEVLAVL